ncbi:HlyD family type I secretion periplasmic adaptor subunit [Grimontia hollisae]|uniref:Membrane fusion protein (MFP) family protein n=1 Tax=Grimontia hollisae TaxID=673 RepID=A0A377HPZ7_GRIHO|nr:HlyD family type I secretion periplasmic adaptor subunit [Grimontia hollisae]MDF2185177.1 HlyD family type I secretion periplasmic adaptor subunit [Grimontia hollisae]STO58320.1 Type I secretion system membrane fusion protein PrsE [Grimontia hollisae]STQ76849.1 Type I secretion system membrane fusion protein PrsE [Grimontia hollisae]
MTNALKRDDIEMTDDVYGAMLTDAPVRYRLVIWWVFAFFVAIITWAAFASLDRVTRGEGKVIPSSQVQLIQSLDGGILQAMYVQEGQLVKQGEPLARIDDTRFRSDFAQQEEEVSSLRANIIRMRSELRSIKLSPAAPNWREQIAITLSPLEFPSELEESEPALIEGQRQEYEGRLLDLKNRLEILARQILQKQQESQEVESKIRTLSNSFGLIKRELKITIPLARKGIVSEIDLLKLERQVNDLKGELSSLRLMQPKIKASVDEAILKRREAALAFSNETRAKMSELETRLSRLTQAQVGAQDKVDKAVITAPVTGTIKTIHINTLGGVVQPGIDLIEIVPAEDQLLIEAKIAPKDIAFLHAGLPSVVKVTAYDFTRYGGLNGTLEHISADTTQDEEGNSFYLVRIRTEKSSLEKKDGSELPIIPGMLTSVDIITGKRTVLEYLLNPILRAKESALRER